MEDILNNFEEEVTLTDKEVFTKIWTTPRQVFKFINNSQYEKYMFVLLVLSGISRAFDRASSGNMGDRMSLFSVIALCVVMGGLLGWLSYYIYAALISWTGKWLGGIETTYSILRVLAYAMIPAVCGMVLLIPQIAIFGQELFRSDADIYAMGQSHVLLLYGFALVEFALGIYSLVLLVIGVSEVQKISVGKSILNLILAVLVIVLPILILVLIMNT